MITSWQIRLFSLFAVALLLLACGILVAAPAIDELALTRGG